MPWTSKDFSLLNIIDASKNIYTESVVLSAVGLRKLKLSLVVFHLFANRLRGELITRLDCTFHSTQTSPGTEHYRILCA
jgi:hypothetical protein